VKDCIEAVAVRGSLALWYQGRKVTIDLEGLRLLDVMDYIRRRTGMDIHLLAGMTTDARGMRRRN
jgi:hypothetical protein